MLGHLFPFAASLWRRSDEKSFPVCTVKDSLLVGEVIVRGQEVAFRWDENKGIRCYVSRENSAHHVEDWSGG
jgi:hypothetical protein